MAKSDAWKKTLQERGWLDLYLSGEPFGVFLEAEQERVTAILKRIGLVQ
jgi:putative tricarboxylic transport membrane protein